MNTDADPGEGFHLAGEAGLLGNKLQICVHLCSSVVELPFLGLSVLSAKSVVPTAVFRFTLWGRTPILWFLA